MEKTLSDSNEPKTKNQNRQTEAQSTFQVAAAVRGTNILLEGRF